MTRSELSILFLGKQDDEHCAQALNFCQDSFNDVTDCLGVWGDPLPKQAAEWEGDYIISYLSRWVVPAYLIESARIASFNFHPASPEYPGIGCNNFALYEDASEYGVTCHHMIPKVDTGDLIAVKRFPIYPTDDVASLLSRTYDTQLALFHEIIGGIAEGNPLPSSQEKWTRKPFSRKEFDKLFIITPDMSQDEIARRVRAINYNQWKPYIQLGDYRFELKTKEDK